MANEITEVTRRNIIDYLTASYARWAGRLPEDEFLARLYDLTALPSKDPRFRNAAGDIRQHRLNWSDWPDDWVFYDDRFNLLRTSDEAFLRFICETIHPVVRPESEEAREMATIYNSELQTDGWRIVEGKQISGRPIFIAERIHGRTDIFEEPTGWPKVDRQLQEIRMRLDTADSEEECQAVGLLCREVLISVGQAVFDPNKHESLDGVVPSSTDAKRILESIFETELRGGPNKEARNHAKAALGLALALQHKRTADYQTAALCAEATVSVVNLLAVISGRRRRTS
ncbi:MAG: hypothetical protein FJ023_08505 [Chloroflexi bacterium]|nr:hypothetical protein [Chloroflexota bacterium]